MPIEQLNATTYVVTLPYGDKAEIGDREADNFKPLSLRVT